MRPIRSPLLLLAAVFVLASLTGSGVATGQAGGTLRPPIGGGVMSGQMAAQPPVGGGAVPPGAVAQDARETRQQLEQTLRRLPPAVGGALRLDSSLLRHESYLATYPELAAFLQRHPEIASNPEYYLQNVNLLTAAGGRITALQPTTSDPRIEAIRMWRNMLEGFTVLVVFLVVTGALVWLLGALMAQRRWTRTSRVQAEMHGKLLDRFSTNEDLLAYIQTPAARRFLEASPLAVETRAPQAATAAPLSRILWSVQGGVVLAAAGLGLLYISTRVIDEIGQVLSAAGILMLALGGGFIVSAAASYVLSRRLGLLEAPAAGGRSDPTEA